MLQHNSLLLLVVRWAANLTCCWLEEASKLSTRTGKERRSLQASANSNKMFAFLSIRNNFQSLQVSSWWLAFALSGHKTKLGLAVEQASRSASISVA